MGAGHHFFFYEGLFSIVVMKPLNEDTARIFKGFFLSIPYARVENVDISNLSDYL